MVEIAVIGQDEQSLRLFVQPSDRYYAQPSIALRDQLHDRFVLRIVRRRNVACRLKKNDRCFPVRCDFYAVQKDTGAGLIDFPIR